jgi:hypothetical protein
VVSALATYITMRKARARHAVKKGVDINLVT